MSKNPEEKTWICPTCGPIPPFALADGWYARRPCACEQRRRQQKLVEEQRQARQQALRQQVYGWLGSAWKANGLEQRTFATFGCARLPGEPPEIAQMRHQAYEAAWTFAQQPRGVLALYGDYGTGKSHLLAAIANHLTDVGQPCLFASTGKFFDALQERIARGEDHLALVQRALHTPLLILDDLDKPKRTDFRQDIFYQLIDGHTTARRPLAISCNCRPDELDPYVGKAVRSRLMEGLIPVPMYGTDYRLQASG